MVLPPALMAATPVGAQTAICLNVFCLMYFSRVVLPVPAFPVKNTGWLVWLINSSTFSNCGLISISAILQNKNK